MTKEVWPGSDVESDDEWDDWLREVSFTEYHPSSTCAMMPLEQGGVVDANLRVYGLANVRVADASVPPIAFSAHLMSSTYGIAEQASTLIRNYYNIDLISKSHNSTNSTKPSKTGSDKSAASSSSTTSTAASASTTNGSDGGFSVQPWTFISTILAFVALEYFL